MLNLKVPLSDFPSEHRLNLSKMSDELHVVNIIPGGTDHGSDHKPAERLDLICNSTGIFYLTSIVNKFTITKLKFIGRHILSRFFNNPGATRIPNRTRRRVHVMPWATPIKRIGKMRIGYLSPGEDNSISDIYGRDQCLNLPHLFHDVFISFQYLAAIISMPLIGISF
jgi:hypothetical protein